MTSEERARPHDPHLLT